MEVQPTALEGVRLLRPRRFHDARGWFAETWKQDAFAASGIDAVFIQDNLSFSEAVGTVRGLHFQIPPQAQAKLVSVPAGRVLDVVVDLRDGPEYGRHLTVELSAENGLMLFIPAGLAHGFCTVEPRTLFAYKVTAPYAPRLERRIRWDDPALGIDWPVRADAAVLSPADADGPALADLPRWF